MAINPYIKTPKDNLFGSSDWKKLEATRDYYAQIVNDTLGLYKGKPITMAQLDVVTSEPKEVTTEIAVPLRKSEEVTPDIIQNLKKIAAHRLAEKLLEEDLVELVKVEDKPMSIDTLVTFRVTALKKKDPK